ncbi:MAG: GTP 3',8-cyclase MoaA [Desulfobacterales bacterium]|nr:GTP 3',8-cyclase MoaA [Desulfobacterales bacterium]
MSREERLGINNAQLIDQHGRRLNYLRISVTDRCNLKCLYCVPRKGVPKLSHEEILTYEEILRLARIGVGLGITKIRLTGGEPLVRKGLCEFIPRLAALKGLKDISLTSNGFYLKDKLEKIRAGGIRRLNISLDSLHRAKYKEITGLDGLKQVLAGIRAARRMDFYPIKINMVPIKGLNDDEVLDFAGLSLEYPYHIRFIEYMPLGGINPDKQAHHIPNSLLRKQVEKLGKLVPIPGTAIDGPAERHKFEGAPGEIGFISPLTQHFCHMCNRLRLTARGHLRPCLLSNQEEDPKNLMRNGASDHDLRQIFLKAALGKPSKHHLSSEDSSHLASLMSSIGG